MKNVALSPKRFTVRYKGFSSGTMHGRNPKNVFRNYYFFGDIDRTSAEDSQMIYIV
jgi:hypothetical protein